MTSISLTDDIQKNELHQRLQQRAAEEHPKPAFVLALVSAVLKHVVLCCMPITCQRGAVSLHTFTHELQLQL